MPLFIILLHWRTSVYNEKKTQHTMITSILNVALEHAIAVYIQFSFHMPHWLLLWVGSRTLLCLSVSLIRSFLSGCLFFCFPFCRWSSSIRYVSLHFFSWSIDRCTFSCSGIAFFFGRKQIFGSFDVYWIKLKIIAVFPLSSFILFVEVLLYRHMYCALGATQNIKKIIYTQVKLIKRNKNSCSSRSAFVSLTNE